MSGSQRCTTTARNKRLLAKLAHIGVQDRGLLSCAMGSYSDPVRLTGASCQKSAQREETFCQFSESTN